MNGDRALKRWAVRVAVVAGLALAVTAAIVAARLSFMLTGYKAKMLCSEVFVAGRSVDAVLADLEVDDLRLLRMLPAVVSRDQASASVSLPFGLRRRHARVQAGVGCTLDYDGRATSTVDAAPAPPPPAMGLAVDSDPRIAAVIAAAFHEPNATQPRRTRAVLVIVDGRIVAEGYAAGFGPDTRFPGWSMTKSALNALVGVLVGQGRLSLNSTAPVPAWRSAGDPRGRITLDHLLRMSSGLAFGENMSLPLTDVMEMLFEAPDMAAFAAGARMEAEPGSAWQYSSATSLIVSGILRRTLGDAEYGRFPAEALFRPLGMNSSVMEADTNGTFVASSYMYATARDWGRLGGLYVQDGVWHGTRVLPTGWVAYTRTPAPADREQAYGAHVWLKIPASYNAAKAALPPDAFHAAGHEGQFVTIVPSRRAVIVRLGKTRHAGAWDQGRFVADVLAGLE